MKISELSTAQAAEALVRVAVCVSNISEDSSMMEIIGKPMSFEGLNKRGVQGRLAGKWSAFIAALLKDHQEDVFGILAAVNASSVEQISAQPLMDTLHQLDDIRHDEELIRFFSSFMPPAETGPSEPSADAATASPLED